MFREGILDKTLRTIKRFIPRRIFSVAAPFYHQLLAYTGAFAYGFPSRSLTVIGVTGTKGKSTTVWLIAKIFEHAGIKVAAIGSLGYKIGQKEWPNLLKMTMPGRWKIQKFLHEAVEAGCKYAVIECPSEGLAQSRHLGIQFDCAVFTSLHPEHLEAHGSFEAYRDAKQILFRVCRGVHVINADDPGVGYFSYFPSRVRVTYGTTASDVRAESIITDAQRSSFVVDGVSVSLQLGGIFNISNALAAMTVARMYGVSFEKSSEALQTITNISGRMEWIQREPFGVVIDYAHTPDSLLLVYQTLFQEAHHKNGNLIAVLGSAGGGRDRAKRARFGAIAEKYADKIILTDEDPFDENPDSIVHDIASGFSSAETKTIKCHIEMDRREAIRRAISLANSNDIIIVTGKGSETSMALANGKKIPWSDAKIAQELLKK